ncbi:hypothetical protein DOTSEDRAFT_73075 [Dothistroma septosporum NZE10]|uniref:PXA domain-containing protein n=1 Tax=Dothistroma septosporum (strain NZE10 / CBS 128990) TaxID=675120 RepID=N1PHU2_DOTSN|nr:hypothetical protein DOTSEDRAFT_73075 [Dothistroma septosporum NZE10]
MADTRPDVADAGNNAPVAVPDEAPIDDPSSVKKENADVIASARTSSTTSGASALQRLTDHALEFLSHASNETLGACLVGLGATTYLVLGRIGLVIIGVAGGVVLKATWEGIRHDDRDEATKKAEQDRKREAGVDVARRVLEWRRNGQDEITTEHARVYANQALDYSGFEPETAAALNTFTDAVIKDYVHYWYDPTLPGEPSFPSACRQTFTAFMLSLSGHLRRKRPADAFLDFVTNASSIIIVFLQELSVALNASPNTPPQEAIRAYIKMKPDCSLAYMLDQESQNLKLADASEDILQSYLDPKTYNCPPVHAFLKQVLAQLVLGYTVELCSKPDWINDWIVYGLEESETTKEVMDIVDAGVDGRAQPDTPKVDEQFAKDMAEVKSMKEGAARNSTDTASQKAHRRKMSKAEEAMDEAMQEARRLTELMIEEDRLKAQEDQQRSATSTIAEDSSDGATQGAPTPSSSQSGQDHQELESMTSAEDSTTANGKPSTPDTQFTNFDMLVPNTLPTALATESPAQYPTRASPAVLTLHNATIAIFDDADPGKGSIKSRPDWDYLLQIEPASSAFPGWMIARKYQDFEMLHEVLRRISVISGVQFTWAELPRWKVHTKASLRTELERYITDAVRFQPLAECEGMKRFLEKDRGLNKSPGASKGFGWPTPDAFGKIGGDMMNVLTKAPKQVAGGGNVVFKGVTGGSKAVFGGVAGLVGGKKSTASQGSLSRSTTNASLSGSIEEAHKPRPSISTRQSFQTDGYASSTDAARQSQDSLRAVPQTVQEKRRGSTATTASVDSRPRQSTTLSRPESIVSHPELGLTAEISRSPTVSPEQLPSKESLDESISLPPPPSEMPADYDASSSPSRRSTDTYRSQRSTNLDQRLAQSMIADGSAPATPPRPAKQELKKKEPLSERETSVAVELMFAVITELYQLSGAWQIRRTLLTAAKTFLLRPGNPQLGSIRDLLQTSMLDANLNDSGLAHQIYKLRENTLPTAEEMETWRRDYPEKTAEQREGLRIKARKLLVTKGMPQALTSVMGAAASGEALGKVFDCLQVPEVSRGLIFGLMLQALRVVTH